MVAADGGARHAGALGLRIDRWVGDGDSLGEDGIAALEAAAIPVERAPVDKDESDTELAVAAALTKRPSAITILGALGGPRLDHALANLGAPRDAGAPRRRRPSRRRRCTRPAAVGARAGRLA